MRCYVVSEKVTLHKKWSFPLRIFLVNMTKSAVSCGFGHIYWRSPQWKTSIFVQCNFLEYDQAENSSVCRLHLQNKIFKFSLRKISTNPNRTTFSETSPKWEQFVNEIEHTGSSVHRFFTKDLFLKFSQSLRESTYPSGLKLYSKETPAQDSLVNFANTFLQNTTRRLLLSSCSLNTGFFSF